MLCSHKAPPGFSARVQTPPTTSFSFLKCSHVMAKEGHAKFENFIFEFDR